MPDHADVVVAGAGFAGLAAARELSGKREALVVDPWPWFEFLPNIHELVSGRKKPRQLRLSRKRFVERLGHRFVPDRVEAIDPARREVSLESGESLSYRRLILALGGATNTFGVPGVEKFAFGFKSVEECHTIGRRLSSLARGRGPFSVVIAGGGIEGVEALGEVLRRYRNVPGLSLSLVEGQPRLLASAPEGVSRAIVDHSRKWKVRFHFQTTVSRVDEGSATLSSGEVLASDCTIWTGGVAPFSELSEWGLSQKSGQWAAVDENLVSRVAPEVLVAGDTAGTDPPLSKQAYHALDMGRHAAANLLAADRGRAPRAFKPSSKPTLVSFGDLDAFLLSSGLTLAGPALGTLKEAVFQKVMADLDPFGPLLRVPRAARRAAGLLPGRTFLKHPGIRRID